MSSILELENLSLYEHLNNIKKEDKEGWLYLKQIVDYCKHNYKYKNDHKQYNKSPDSINFKKLLIVREYISTDKHKDFYIAKKYESHIFPCDEKFGLWCSYYPNNIVSYHCKNPLYFNMEKSDNYLHLSTSAHGSQLIFKTLSKLSKYNLFFQKYEDLFGVNCIEINLLFSIQDLYTFMNPPYQLLFHSKFKYDIIFLTF